MLAEDGAEGGWCLVGIQRRGDILAARLRERLLARGVELEIGTLDITLYRDDFSPDQPQPLPGPSNIPFAVDGARVLLIDDVFQTGRTIRAALTQLADFGRARQVVLAVFIERALRELPISPDIVGLQVERAPEERVQLRLRELDDKDEVVVQRPDARRVRGK